MVYRMDLTYDEIVEALSIKYTSATSIGYLPEAGRYEISDLSFMINSSLPNEEKQTIQLLILD